MARGPSVQWLSAFPQEEEILFPPLTYIQPTKAPPEVIEVDGRTITVVEVVPHFGST